MEKQSPLRAKISIHGAVQGVGFRPFIFRLATRLNLPGWVMNTSEGLFLEVEGSKTTLDYFIEALQMEKPAHSYIQAFEVSLLDPLYFERFEIRESEASDNTTALILPDIATCSECIQEIFDPSNRRYHYPFTNCTHCGPRFSIIESLPYDRANTSMKEFTMCAMCQQEYDDPLDRRFHAQPNACSECGPQLELWDPEGKILEAGSDALTATVEALRAGKIAAVKGLGGFHLLVDATNSDSVRRLRHRKGREEKPFAVMYPSIESLHQHCDVSPFEKRLLQSSASPIVLLRKKEAGLMEEVAPGNPYIGAMLPYTPLHHLLLRFVERPIVATSGNLSDEPIYIDEQEALHRLNQIADLFLVHNRPILRHVDDSIVRVLMDRELVLRRARGYAPLPITIALSEGLETPALAVGGHLKNTVAISKGSNVFVSQHIGDLETKEAYEAFTKVVDDFKTLYHCKVGEVVCDLHPDYMSSQYAKAQDPAATMIQHHYAHVASCMAENHLDGKLLGVSWDGTGHGIDGTIWGGEFLLTTDESFKQVSSLRKFRLPGGSAAIKEPRRTAAGLLYELFGEKAFEMQLPVFSSFRASESSVLLQMLKKGIRSPYTSSAGRLFDAVASILNLRQATTYEGQTAMELEFAAMKTITDASYDFWLKPDADQNLLTVDWAPMVWEILEEIKANIASEIIAGKFHNTLAEVIIAVAKQFDQERVVLTGGCFQNKHLTERAITRLRAEGFRPYWHQRVPPNDGGLSLGQIYAAKRAAVLQRSKHDRAAEQRSFHVFSNPR